MFTWSTVKCNIFPSPIFLQIWEECFFPVQCSWWQKWRSRFLSAWDVRHFTTSTERAPWKPFLYLSLDAWLCQVILSFWEWRIPQPSSHLRPAVDGIPGLVHLSRNRKGVAAFKGNPAHGTPLPRSSSQTEVPSPFRYAAVVSRFPRRTQRTCAWYRGCEVGKVTCTKACFSRNKAKCRGWLNS